MTKHTGRDEAWSEALRLALDGHAFPVGELPRHAATSERTARDVLDTMAEMGWLEKEYRHGLPDAYSRGERLPDNLTAYQ